MMELEADQDRGLGLRELKKRRTRRALVRAALRLFAEQGYDRTTLAEIAAAADVSPRTFFSYFASKDDVVFFDEVPRRERALAVITARTPDDSITATLLRAMDEVFSPDSDIDLALELITARDALVASVPTLQARELSLLFEMQRQLAHALHDAYPGELGLMDAMAVIGAVGGAQNMVATACQERGDSPEEMMTALRRATELAVHGVGCFDAASPVSSEPDRG